jgi:hypothetical protein
MKIRMLTGMAGERFAYQAGDEVELPAPEAQRLVARGQAEAIAPVVETGMRGLVETAARRVRGARQTLGKVTA